MFAQGLRRLITRLVGLPTPARQVCPQEKWLYGPSPLAGQGPTPGLRPWAGHQNPIPSPWTSCPEILGAPARWTWVMLRGRSLDLLLNAHTIRAYTHTCIYTCIHTYAHTHVRTHTCTHTFEQPGHLSTSPLQAVTAPGAVLSAQPPPCSHAAHLHVDSSHSWGSP